MSKHILMYLVYDSIYFSLIHEKALLTEVVQISLAEENHCVSYDPNWPLWMWSTFLILLYRDEIFPLISGFPRF